MVGIKEFVEEREPEDRSCLLCNAQPPEHLKAKDMRGGRGHWYSNAVLHRLTRRIARFYLCPKHQSRRSEAWQWARDGFIEEEIKDLKGMEAVRLWLTYHPELRKYVEK